MDLQHYSDALAAAVEKAGRSTVTVDARGRIPATGVVWSAAGEILTADHVVRKDDDIRVFLPDGTEHQAKLLGRFAKNIVVNFDPDTAGAAAAERSLTLLVSEDFAIKVLTLEQGFDPDLFIRKKGKQAYADALTKSQRYFDYLVERARKQFPVATAEGKVSAVNFLLPHIQRVPSRIVRDELAADIAHKLAIDSHVLRDELRHVAASRSATQVKAPANVLITPVEKLLIRALASAGQLGHDPVTAREGQDPDFDAARQAHYVLTEEKLHAGLGTERLLSALLQSAENGTDPMSLPLDDADRRLLASVLMEEAEDLSPEALEDAFSAIRERQLERQRRELLAELASAERKGDTGAVARLAMEKIRLDRAILALQSGT